MSIIKYQSGNTYTKPKNTLDDKLFDDALKEEVGFFGRRDSTELQRVKDSYDKKVTGRNAMTKQPMLEINPSLREKETKPSDRIAEKEHKIQQHLASYRSLLEKRRSLEKDLEGQRMMYAVTYEQEEEGIAEPGSSEKERLKYRQLYNQLEQVEKEIQAAKNAKIQYKTGGDLRPKKLRMQMGGLAPTLGEYGPMDDFSEGIMPKEQVPEEDREYKPRMYRPKQSPEQTQQIRQPEMSVSEIKAKIEVLSKNYEANKEEIEELRQKLKEKENAQSQYKKGGSFKFKIII